MVYFSIPLLALAGWLLFRLRNRWIARDPARWPTNILFLDHVDLVKRHLRLAGWELLDPKPWALAFVRARKGGAYLNLIIHSQDTLSLPALIKTGAELSQQDTCSVGLLTTEQVHSDLLMEAKASGVFIVHPQELAACDATVKAYDGRIRAEARVREEQLAEVDSISLVTPVTSALAGKPDSSPVRNSPMSTSNDAAGHGNTEAKQFSKEKAEPATQQPLCIIDDAQCASEIAALLTGSAPIFLGRIGGSDTDVVAALLRARSEGILNQWGEIWRHRQIVERYNGYYDVHREGPTFWRYVTDLLDIYNRMSHAMLCNRQLQTIFMPQAINPVFLKDDIANRKGFEVLLTRPAGIENSIRCYPYPFVEKLTIGKYTMLRVFAEVLPGKRVLVISPFARSITQNFHRRRNFFKNFDYPDFDLQTFNTPITYTGLPREFYPHETWFETTDWMKEQISKLDFDIALLSCGSYALPLGEFIAASMRKKAVYVGGVLQMMFGVTGRRYDNPFFTDQINPEQFIPPVEAEDYLKHVQISPQQAKEAFGAYF